MSVSLYPDFAGCENSEQLLQCNAEFASVPKWALSIYKVINWLDNKVGRKVMWGEDLGYQVYLLRKKFPKVQKLHKFMLWGFGRFDLSIVDRHGFDINVGFAEKDTPCFKDLVKYLIVHKGVTFTDEQLAQMSGLAWS